MAHVVPPIELYVRGEIPSQVGGHFIVAMNRRSKDRSKFSRWHDSQADILRLDVSPGRPGRITASILEIDSSGRDLGSAFLPTDYEQHAFGRDSSYGYATQPNHGINVADKTIWATNLLFGAPLEIDLNTWRPRRLLRYLAPTWDAPRVSTTAHFAWSRDKTRAYFHQSLLKREDGQTAVRADNLLLVRIDTRFDSDRIWKIKPPAEDADLAAANFHSAFLWEEDGAEYIGLLRTGAVLESLRPHEIPIDHNVIRMPTASIWMVKIDESADELQASLLPGLDDFHGMALSHLDVIMNEPELGGFVLFANCKQSDVAEETHGINIYGQDPGELSDHYAGSVAEPFNFGSVMRYEWRHRRHSIRIFERPYDCSAPSLGHSWLPININVEEFGEAVFCSFSGFQPRLLPQHVYRAYADIAVDPARVRHVPPLIMRLDAKTLEPMKSPARGHVAYAEPVAIAVVGDVESGYVCTFSPELGFRILRAADMNSVVAYAVNNDLHQWEDSHFRPDPPHMVYVPA